MPKIETVISYDLATPPGLQEDFKKVLVDKGWIFEIEGKSLPNTTCYAVYKKTDDTPENASSVAIGELKDAEAEMKKKHASFRIDRYLVVSFPKDAGKLTSFAV